MALCHILKEPHLVALGHVENLVYCLKNLTFDTSLKKASLNGTGSQPQRTSFSGTGSNTRQCPKRSKRYGFPACINLLR